MDSNEDNNNRNINIPIIVIIYFISIFLIINKFKKESIKLSFNLKEGDITSRALIWTY